MYANRVSGGVTDQIGIARSKTSVSNIRRSGSPSARSTSQTLQKCRRVVSATLGESVAQGGTMTAVTVRSVASAEDLQSFKAMTVSYLEWLNEDLCFQGIEDELSGLPGCYSPDAQGCMLLAFSTSSAGGEVCIGAVALRALQGKQTDGLTKVSSVPVDDICEMKRLFVLPEHHGKGAGAALARAVMQRATELGYKAMVMDTLERLEGANKLYRSLGFENIEPYNHCPLPGVLYFFKLLR